MVLALQWLASPYTPGVNLSFVLHHRSLHVIGAQDMKNEHFHFLKKPRKGQLGIRLGQDE